MSEVKDKLITAENLKNAYDDNKRAITELKGDLDNFRQNYNFQILDYAIDINNKRWTPNETHTMMDVSDIDSVEIITNNNGCLLYTSPSPRD